MNINFKKITLGAVVAVSLVSTGALAQQKEMRNMDDMSQTMPDGEIAEDKMMSMMKDPEMRRNMMEMMKNCNRMMDRMEDMSSTQPKSKHPRKKR